MARGPRGANVLEGGWVIAVMLLLSVLLALLPLAGIAWIVVAAVYLYDIAVYSGQFAVMKESIAAITPT